MTPKKTYPPLPEALLESLADDLLRTNDAPASVFSVSHHITDYIADGSKKLRPPRTIALTRDLRSPSITLRDLGKPEVKIVAASKADEVALVIHADPDRISWVFKRDGSDFSTPYPLDVTANRARLTRFISAEIDRMKSGSTLYICEALDVFASDFLLAPSRTLSDRTFTKPE